MQITLKNLPMKDTAPSGVAIIVETLTDNKNRTAGNVRSAFTKGSGKYRNSRFCILYV